MKYQSDHVINMDTKLIIHDRNVDTADRQIL